MISKFLIFFVLFSCAHRGLSLGDQIPEYHRDYKKNKRMIFAEGGKKSRVVFENISSKKNPNYVYSEKKYLDSKKIKSKFQKTGRGIASVGIDYYRLERVSLELQKNDSVVLEDGLALMSKKSFKNLLGRIDKKHKLDLKKLPKVRAQKGKLEEIRNRLEKSTNSLIYQNKAVVMEEKLYDKIVKAAEDYPKNIIKREVIKNVEVAKETNNSSPEIIQMESGTIDKGVIYTAPKSYYKK